MKGTLIAVRSVVVSYMTHAVRFMLPAKTAVLCLGTDPSSQPP